jgi:hypothetical protein
MYQHRHAQVGPRLPVREGEQQQEWYCQQGGSEGGNGHDDQPVAADLDDGVAGRVQQCSEQDSEQDGRRHGLDKLDIGASRQGDSSSLCRTGQV